MESIFTTEFTLYFLYGAIRATTPILFAALGALISRQAGILNIAIEGTMLTSALFGVIFSAYSQSVFIGLIGAMIAGILINAFMAYSALVLKSNMFLTGLAVNLVASGGTIFILYLLTGDKGSSSSLPSLVVPTLDLPIIKDIPYVGDVLSGHNYLTYLSFVFVIIVYFVIYKTDTGLRIRAVGENPDAAKSVGVDVVKTQFYSFVLAGLFSSLGGAYMSMGYLSFFSRDMMAGRGFIGMAASNLTAGRPVWTMITSLAFGFVDSLSLVMQSLEAPVEFVQMTPYVATIVGMVLFSIFIDRKE